MKKLLSIMKIPGIVVGCIGSLYVVFVYFDGMKDDIGEVQETVDHINIEQTWMAEDIAGIQDTLAEYEKEHKIQTQKINSISWGLQNHENYSPEQFKEVMEELLKKNYGPIVWSEWNPLEWTLSNQILSEGDGGMSFTEHTGVTLNSSH